MKVKDIKTYIVSQKLDDNTRFCYSQAWYNARTIMILEIICDDGLIGWGEAFGNAFINKSVVENVYKPYLIGKNPFDSEMHWDNLYNMLRDNGQKGSCIEALSAVDNALWDIKGKYTHLPVYTLLGGARRDRIKAYATGLYKNSLDQDPMELVEEAIRYKDAGYKAIKIKIGYGLKSDIDLIEKLRIALGDDIELMVDANHAYNSMEAIKLAKAIEKFDIKWFEEPVPPEDIEGYKEVRANTSIAISGGEAEFTQYGFDSFIRNRCVDILQPDCSITGGLTAFRRITTLAKIANTQVYPHVWGSAIAVAVGVNACFYQPNYPESLVNDDVYFEYDRTENIFREELNLDKLKVVDGYIEKWDYEGLGFNVNRKLIEKYQVG